VLALSEGGVERTISHTIANGCIATPLSALLNAFTGTEEAKKTALRARVVEYDAVRRYVNALLAAGDAARGTVRALFVDAVVHPDRCIVDAARAAAAAATSGDGTLADSTPAEALGAV
jgi:hypothetical protein